MGKHSHCGQACIQSRAVGTHINAVCQSTDDERAGHELCKVGNKIGTQLLTVLACMACTHNGDYVTGIKVGIAHRVKYQRSIIALGKTAGIGLIAHADEFYIVLFYELHLTLGKLDKRTVGEQRHELRCCIGHDILYMRRVLKQFLCAADLLDKAT